MQAEDVRWLSRGEDRVRKEPKENQKRTRLIEPILGSLLKAFLREPLE